MGQQSIKSYLQMGLNGMKYLNLLKVLLIKSDGNRDIEYCLKVYLEYPA